MLGPLTLLASLSGGHTAGVEQALILLLIVAAAVAVTARRLGAPYTVGLVLVGLALGATSWFGELRLSSDLVFYVFLPVLLFEAAFNLEARHLVSEWRRILALAVPGVLVAFALTAAGLHLAGGVTWSVALLFGALISATDPVSVLALFRHLGVAPRLTTLVDAESLFNDGAAAVVFAVVVAAVVDHRHVTALWAAGDFVWMAAGGLGVGLAAGFAVSALLRALDDHLLEITLSTIAAYGSFLLAQRLGMSGVVAVVAAGIVVGSVGQRRAMSPVTRVTMGTVWEYAAFVANSLIFLLIGLRIDLGGIAAHLGLVLLAFVVVLGARAVAIYGFGLASRLRGPGLPLRWQHVLVWGGLRGTVALALVLSLPADVAGRQTLEVVTFGVVLLSLVGQGLSMPWLARRLGLVGGEAAGRARTRGAARGLRGSSRATGPPGGRGRAAARRRRAPGPHLGSTGGDPAGGYRPAGRGALAGRAGATGGPLGRAAGAAPPRGRAAHRRRDPAGRGAGAAAGHRRARGAAGRSPGVRARRTVPSGHGAGSIGTRRATAA